jgi:hypothetical protein
MVKGFVDEPPAVCHLHDRPINGSALINPMPTDIPMTHKWKLVILNIFLVYFLVPAIITILSSYVKILLLLPNRL